MAVLIRNTDKPFTRYVHKRIEDNKNFLVGIVGPTGCLSKYTKLYGYKENLEQLYNSGKKIVNTVSLTNSGHSYYLKKSKSEIIYSGRKKLYEIELEDGRIVKATEDHIFFKCNGKMKEYKVKNLKKGDYLKTYPKNYYKNYLTKSNIDTTKRRTEKYFNNNKYKKTCKRCYFPFYLEKINSVNLFHCKTCREIKKNNYNILKSIKKYGNNKIDFWFLWELNILKNYYYSYSKEKLLNLLKNRNWSGIKHKAKRLKLRRNIKFQYESNPFTSKNNPMYDPEIRKKAMIKQKPIYAKNKMTSIERKVANILDKYNINYEFNQCIITPTTFRFPDFLIKKLIIECDGIYWHSKRKNDEARQKELENMGYDFIRFSDIEINNNILEVEKCIKLKLKI